MRRRGVAWLFWLVCSWPLSGAAAPPQALALEGFSRPLPPHPRLLLHEAGFVRLPAALQGNAEAQEMLRHLREEAREILAAPPCRYELRKSEGLLTVSRTVVRRVQVLALLYRLEGGPGYVARLGEELAQVASFPDWHPSHFLDTAELTHAFALAYDWLYEVWSPEQRLMLRRALVEKGLKPGLAAYGRPEADGWWAATATNWNAVCNSALGLGALALWEEEPELAREVLRAVTRSLPRALKAFEPDGAYPEGPLYWGYATYYLSLFLAAAEAAGLPVSDLEGFPALARTGFFPLYLTSPTGLVFNFADSPPRLPRQPHLGSLPRTFHQPVFRLAQAPSRRPHPLELLWWGGVSPTPEQAKLPLDRRFQGVEVAVFRSSWQDPRGIWVGFKGGSNLGPHAHLDLGTFVLDALGHRWVEDLGPDNYDLPGYFGKSRPDYYRVRAEGHNTLVLNPGPGPDQAPVGRAPLWRFDSRPERAAAVADLTPAYAPLARRVQRGVALLSRGQVLVQAVAGIADQGVQAAVARADLFHQLPYGRVVSHVERPGGGARAQRGGALRRRHLEGAIRPLELVVDCPQRAPLGASQGEIGQRHPPLLAQLLQRICHAILVALRLGLDGDGDNRLREADGLEDQGMARVRQRVARKRILQPNGREDVASVDLADFLSLIGVHTQNPGRLFRHLFDGIIDILTGFQGAGIDPEDGDLAGVAFALELCGDRFGQREDGGAAGGDLRKPD